MQAEKADSIKKLKLEKELARKDKAKELREEARLEKVRKKDIQKFIRLEQAEVREEQAEKQKKIFRAIKLREKNRTI